MFFECLAKYFIDEVDAVDESGCENGVDGGGNVFLERVDESAEDDEVRCSEKAVDECVVERFILGGYIGIDEFEAVEGSMGVN